VKAEQLRDPGKTLNMNVMICLRCSWFFLGKFLQGRSPNDARFEDRLLHALIPLHLLKRSIFFRISIICTQNRQPWTTGGRTSKGSLGAAHTNKHVMTSYSFLNIDVSTVFMLGLSHIVVMARYLCILLAGALMLWLPRLQHIQLRGFGLSNHFRDRAVKWRNTYYSSSPQSPMPYTVHKHVFASHWILHSSVKPLKSLKTKQKILTKWIPL
jgi:hypothetical protein